MFLVQFCGGWDWTLAELFVVFARAKYKIIKLQLTDNAEGRAKEDRETEDGPTADRQFEDKLTD